MSKKYNIIETIAIFFIITLIVQISPLVVNAADSILVNYNFDNNVLDQSGNGNNGTLGGTTAYVEYSSGTALSLNGAGWVSLPQSLITNNPSFTIALSFKTTSPGGIIGYQNNLTGVSGPSQFVPILSIRTDGKLYAEMWTTSSMSVISSAVVNDGNWHRVVMTSGTSSIRVYLDGVDIGGASGTPDHLAMIYSQIGANDGMARSLLSQGWDYFAGLIDDFTFYSNALTPTEVAKTSQTISFGAISTKTINDGTFELAATATSGLPVTYTSSNTTVASISGSTVTLVGAGTANITASQAGDSTYSAAPQVVQSLTVSRYLLSASNTTPFYGVGGASVSVDNGIIFRGDNISGAKVYVDGGFQSGDILSFTNQSGITGSYNSTNGVLALSGSTTAANYQTAFRSIKFSSTSNSVTSRSITFSTDTGATSYKLSETGHYYKFISASGKTWAQASSAASSSTYLGRRGYLATITSLAENQFIASKCAGDGWLGATDDGHDKQWYWVTGPEGEVTTYGYSGTKFMTQNAYPTGIGVYSVESGFYQNFSANEPNDWASAGNGQADGENYLHMIASSGAWNDYAGSNTGTVGYIVEFGGMSGDTPEEDSSLASKTITISTSLVPPTSITAVRGNGQAVVSFTESGSNGGSEITGYTVTSSPGGITASAISSPITVTGLTNGTAYTFKIYATNANGNSDPSASSNSVTPSTVPGAPIGVSAVKGNSQAVVSFSAPANNGGASITGYTVTSSPGGITASAISSPITVTGLTNGTAYTFTVYATNLNGNGSASGYSNSVTSSSVPGAPTDVTVLAGSGQAVVTFTAPANNGGAEITEYTAISSPGGITASAISSPITVTGLTNGTAYTFTVYATNLSGNGGESNNSDSVTPFRRSKSTNSETQVVVIVNGVPQDLGTQTESMQDGTKNVSLEVAEEGVTKQIEQIIEEEKNNPLIDKIVEIPVVGTDIGKADVSLTGDLISEMEKEGFSFKVVDDKVSYIIPAAEIKIPEIAKELNSEEDLSNVEIHVIITKPSTSSLAEIEKNAELQGYEVLIPPMTFEVVAINSETKQEISISKFSSYSQKMFELPSGLDLSKITTGVVYNDDGTFSHIPTEIIKVGEKYFAKLNSLTNSTYSIIWNPTTFSDMENRWAKDPANNMGGRLVVSGVGNNKFEPDRAITRGEFAAVVTKALGIYRTHVGLDHYADVAKGSAYYDAASIAEDYGLVTGYSDGTFKPKNKITRQEAMVIMTKAAKIAKLETLSGKTLDDFLDKDQVSKWAKSYVETNVEQGIVLGFKGNLSPKANISRAEVVALFERLLENANLIKN